MALNAAKATRAHSTVDKQRADVVGSVDFFGADGILGVEAIRFKVLCWRGEGAEVDLLRVLFAAVVRVSSSFRGAAGWPTVFAASESDLSVTLTTCVARAVRSRTLIGSSVAR
jgi:hypothetical protein